MLIRNNAFTTHASNQSWQKFIFAQFNSISVHFEIAGWLSFSSHCVLLQMFACECIPLFLRFSFLLHNTHTHKKLFLFHVVCVCVCLPLARVFYSFSNWLFNHFHVCFSPAIIKCCTHARPCKVVCTILWYIHGVKWKRNTNGTHMAEKIIQIRVFGYRSIYVYKCMHLPLFSNFDFMFVNIVLLAINKSNIIQWNNLLLYVHYIKFIVIYFCLLAWNYVFGVFKSPILFPSVFFFVIWISTWYRDSLGNRGNKYWDRSKKNFKSIVQNSISVDLLRWVKIWIEDSFSFSSKFDDQTLSLNEVL